MFKTKKQLKEEIARLELDIEGLKLDKDIVDNQRKIAEGEMRLSKANHKLCVDEIKKLEADIADRIRYTVELEEMVTKLDEENEILKKALEGEETFSSILSTHNDKLNKENENLKEALKKEKDWSSIVSTLNDELNKENAKLKIQTKIDKNYIKNLEKEILKQRQIIKDKDKYISILHDDATLYTTITTKKQNSQLKDKLNRISAILNED